MASDTGVLSAYEKIFTVTQHMLEAAEKGDWDGLTELEKMRGDLVAKLNSIDAAAMQDQELAMRTSEVIRSILKHDEQIRQLTEAWMAELKGVLGSLDVEKKILKAYDAG